MADRHPLSGPTDVPVVATARLDGAEDLARVRRLLADVGTSAGLPTERVDMFTVALSEVATNAVLHGGGAGIVVITGDRTAVTCEVRDRGVGLPAVPDRVPVDPGQLHGRGLWLAGQLCDDIEINGSDGGTTIRLTMRL